MARPRKEQRNRMVIELYEKQGLSFEKIADQLNLNKKSVWELYWRTKGNWPYRKVAQNVGVIHNMV